jgi:hypothetical protein
VLTAPSRCSATSTSTPPFAQTRRLSDSDTDHRLQCGPPQQHDHVVHRLRRRLRHPTVGRNRPGYRQIRLLNTNNRAYDTGSDKIWNTINKGVRKTRTVLRSLANVLDSDNGRTSSRSTWRRPRTTNRAAACKRSEHGTWARHGARWRALYIRVYSTAAKYHEVLIPRDSRSEPERDGRIQCLQPTRPGQKRRRCAYVCFPIAHCNSCDVLDQTVRADCATLFVESWHEQLWRERRDCPVVKYLHCSRCLGCNCVVIAQARLHMLCLACRRVAGSFTPVT